MKKLGLIVLGLVVVGCGPAVTVADGGSRIDGSAPVDAGGIGDASIDDAALDAQIDDAAVDPSDAGPSDAGFDACGACPGSVVFANRGSIGFSVICPTGEVVGFAGTPTWSGPGLTLVSEACEEVVEPIGESAFRVCCVPG